MIPPRGWSILPGLSEEEKALYTFEWGADAKSVREALLDFCQRSATTFFWSFLCDPPGTDGSPAICAFGLGGVLKRTVDSDGKFWYTAITHDRATVKPRFFKDPTRRK